MRTRRPLYRTSQKLEMNLTYKINKSADCVFDFLTNMSKFAAVHPVINKMEYLGENRYLVFETMPLGLIPFSFTYPVTIEVSYESKQVLMKALALRMATIEIAFNVKQEKGYSTVEEEINFKSKLPIKSMLRKIFVKQHHQLFKNIEML